MQFFVYYLFILCTMAILFAILPFITRKTEQFGISIPQSIYDHAYMKKLRKQYAMYTMLLSLIILLSQSALYIFFSASTSHIGFILHTFLFIALSFCIYLVFHRKVKTLKGKENWTETKRQVTVIDTAFRKEQHIISPWYYMFPIFLTIGTIIYTFMVYDKIPTNLPMHTSFNGDIRYAEKTPFNVLLMPITQLFIIAIFLVVHIIIGKAKQQISAANPNISKIQNQLYRKKWSQFLFWISLLMVGLFLFIQLSFIYPFLRSYQTIVTFIFTIIIIIGSIILSIRTGQGGSRIQLDDDTINDHIIDRDEDAYWKLGQFYYNKEDPAIFIEKRFGVGWTNNWAHPISWILLLIIIGTAIGLPILLSNL